MAEEARRYRIRHGCGPTAAAPYHVLWTALFASEASSFGHEADPIEPDPVKAMIAASRTVILEHREIAGVLASSGLFFVSLLAFACLVG